MAKREAWEDKLEAGIAERDMIQTVMFITEIDGLKIDVKLGQLLLGKNSKWIFPVLERPSTYYSEFLAKKGLQTPNIFFIDVGTNYRKGSYIDSPGQLIELKREIVAAADAIASSSPRPERIVLLFSSFVTLELFSDNRLIGIFVHELTLALRQLGVYQVFIIAPGDPLIRYLAPVMDVTIALV